MIITRIQYGRTYTNGNFESSRIDFIADVEKGDDETECFEDLHEWVHEMRKKEVELMKTEKKEKLHA
jgi:hypothetical protein